MNTTAIEVRGAELDALREADEISALSFAFETVGLWAAHRDQAQPEPPQPSNSEIVAGLLASETDRTSAFMIGYNGHNRFPVAISKSVATEMERVFGGQPIVRVTDTSSAIFARANAVREIVTETEPLPEPIIGFAYQIMGAHTIYRHIDYRIAKGFKQEAEEGVEIRVAPGREEAFWRSRIFGSKDNPGIIQAQGALSRLLGNIGEFAAVEYGDKADEFTNAWWAAVNLLKQDAGQTYRGTMEPLITALLQKDLGSVNYQLKQLAFEDDSILPFRSRAKFKPDDEEKEFFAELNAPDEVVVDTRILRPENIAELNEIVAGYVGKVLLMQTTRGSRLAVVRSFGELDPEKSMLVNKYVQPKNRQALLIDYHEVEVGDDGVLPGRKTASQRPVMSYNFMKNLLDGKYIEIPSGDE